MTREDAIDFGEMWLELQEDSKDSKTYEFFKIATQVLEQEPSGDTISRQDAIKAIDEKAKRIKNEDTLNGLAGAVGILLDLPPVNPQPKTGHWIFHEIEDTLRWYECDKCGVSAVKEYNYCPNCGTKMQAESEEL
jgi:hypothetical protein